MTSVIGNENSSLGQVILRSRKSTDLDLSILIKDGHNVSYQVWVLFLLNEATFEEFLNFSFDRLHDVRSELLLLLFDQFSIRFDVEMMHGHLTFETRHVFVAPSKDIYVSPDAFHLSFDDE